MYGMYLLQYSKECKFALGCVIELILLSTIILKHLQVIPKISPICALIVIPLGVLVSNLASAEIVGFIKDKYLWKKVCMKYGPPRWTNYKTLEEWWKSGRRGTNISYELGITQRIVLLLAGIVSIKMFAATAAGWTTFLVAVDWRSNSYKPRVIGHIYAISIALSTLLALVDVLAIRMLLEIGTQVKHVGLII